MVAGSVQSYKSASIEPQRRYVRHRTALGLMVLLAAMSFAVTGCSGKTPGKNAAFTGPGNYTVTVTGTDGFLVHSATYSLTVK